MWSLSPKTTKFYKIKLLPLSHSMHLVTIIYMNETKLNDTSKYVDEDVAILKLKNPSLLMMMSITS